jgi:hypothetical protein
MTRTFGSAFQAVTASSSDFAVVNRVSGSDSFDP